MNYQLKQLAKQVNKCQCGNDHDHSPPKLENEWALLTNAVKYAKFNDSNGNGLSCIYLNDDQMNE